MKIDSTTTTEGTKPFDEELMIRNKVIDWSEIFATPSNSVIPESKDISKEINLERNKQIIELLKNAKTEIDNKGRIYYVVKLFILLSLDEKIDLQNKGYGIYKVPSEIKSFDYNGDTFFKDNPIKHIIMWTPKKEG